MCIKSKSKSKLVSTQIHINFKSNLNSFKTKFGLISDLPPTKKEQLKLLENQGKQLPTQKHVVFLRHPLIYWKVNPNFARFNLI